MPPPSSVNCPSRRGPRSPLFSFPYAAHAIERQQELLEHGTLRAAPGQVLCALQDGRSGLGPVQGIVPGGLAVPGDDGAPGPGSVPSFPSPERAVAALSRVMRYARWRARSASMPSGTTNSPTGRARALVVAAGDGVLDDAAAVDLLSCYGIGLTEFRRVRGPDAAVEAADATEDAGVARDGVVGHVALVDDVAGFDLEARPMMIVGGEVALVHVDVLAVQVAAAVPAALGRQRSSRSLTTTSSPRYILSEFPRSGKL